MPGDKTLLILYPGCIVYETALAAELLHPHLPVEVATPDGQPHAASCGLSIGADIRLADADPDGYRAIILPGGDVESVLESDELSALLRRALAGDAVIGAICAAPLLVARAGLLAGRRFTHGFKDWHTEFLAPYWEGADFVEELVVRDGNLITAMAEGHVDFAVELLAALDLVDEATRERRRRFYKGEIMPSSSPTG